MAQDLAVDASSHSGDLLSLDKARWRLAAVWFPVCGFIIVLLIGQSMGGVYGNDTQRVWGWALPNFLPTLALMLSVFAADALKPHANDTMFVRKNFCMLALCLSLFYLSVFLLSILAQPFLPWFRGPEEAGVEARIQLLETSNMWLAPLQGLVVISLGVLFFLKEGQKKQG
jgi:hypothetical protein